MDNKRHYHCWKRSELREIANIYQQKKNIEIARQFKVTRSSVKSLLYREGLLRFPYVDPRQLPIDWKSRLTVSYTYSPPIRKIIPRNPALRPSKTELFEQQEQQYGRQAFEVLTEVKQCIEANDLETARIKLEEECPLPVYELVLCKVDPPNKVRDCLYALARWVLRSIERNPNTTIVANLTTMTRYMNQKCRFC